MNKCEKCEKIFKYPYLVDRHNEGKRPCITKEKLIYKYNKYIENLDIQINDLTEQSLNLKTTCKFCNKEFLKKGNLERHIEINCNIKKNMIIKKNDYINKKDILSKEIENKAKENNKILKIEKELKTIKKLITNPNTNNTTNNNNITVNQLNQLNQVINNNNNTNNNVVVNMNPLGKENLSHITDSDYKKYLSGFFKGYMNFIEKVHFDDDMPENHNIYITNLNSKYLYVREDKWNVKEKDDVIDRFIRNKYNFLDEKCEELEENNIIDEQTVEKFREFQQNYDNEESQRNTKNNVMLMLYNNRNKAQKIKKLTN